MAMKCTLVAISDLQLLATDEIEDYVRKYHLYSQWINKEAWDYAQHRVSSKTRKTSTK